MRETFVLRSILTALRAFGVPCWRNNTGGLRWTRKGGREAVVKFSFAGAADIFGILPTDGRFLAIEVKRPGQKPTPEQWAFLLAVQRAGGVAYWADDVAHVVHWTPKILAGLWVETDLDLTQWITDETRTADDVKPPAPKRTTKRQPKGDSPQ